MPIYTANFVLADYGTGAVMAVPAHDQRDFEFAKKYGIDIVVVIQPEGEQLTADTMERAYEGHGTMVASGQHDGTPSQPGKKAVVDELEAKGAGSATINYRLRDWGISRQRFWGAPIPVIHCESCGIVGVPHDQLPVVLPKDIKLPEGGGSPLPTHEPFWKVDCPTCGGPARRDTDTFDTFWESSWYFVRYCSPHFDGGMVAPEAAGRFLPVDQYIGGIEHAVMHLLYARFFTKVLRDLGIVGVDEPFSNLLCQGMVCHETYSRGQGPERRYHLPMEVERVDGGVVLKADGQPVDVGPVVKMSKSMKNVVDPEALLARYGADTARLFCLFAAPPKKDLDWSEKGVEGCSRFLGRVWRLVTRRSELIQAAVEATGEGLSPEGVALRRTIHQAIAKVTDDIGRRMHLNTAIAAMMELNNALYAFEGEGGQPRPLEGVEAAAFAEGAMALLRMLSPFAPHFADELWEITGHDGLLEDEAWPGWDAEVAAADTVTVAVMIKGKRRAEIEVTADISEADAIAAALADPRAQKWIGDKPPRFTKYVPGRLVNIVPG